MHVREADESRILASKSSGLDPCKGKSEHPPIPGTAREVYLEGRPDSREAALRVWAICSQSKQLRIDAEDVRRWVEVGERCKRIKFHWDELEKEEAAISEAIQDTPLAYSWKKVREIIQESSESEGEQQAPNSVDVKEDQPVVEAGEERIRLSGDARESE